MLVATLFLNSVLVSPESWPFRTDFKQVRMQLLTSKILATPPNGYEFVCIGFPIAYKSSSACMHMFASTTYVELAERMV